MQKMKNLYSIFSKFYAPKLNCLTTTLHNLLTASYMHASITCRLRRRSLIRASCFLEAIRRNSASQPRHSAVVVTRPSTAENRCTRRTRGFRPVTLRQCVENHATAPALLPTQTLFERGFRYVQTLEQ